jgi:ribonuclease BN (tRNA processing enzyme)
MKVKMGGARGSLPVSGADKVRYGGDTFSLLAEGRDGAQVLVDAGSGVRNLLDRLRPGATLVFTHTHLDHLVGLPMLEKVWPRAMVFPRGDLADVLARVFAPPVWPVELPAVEFPNPVPPMAVGGLLVSWQAVAHPDGCVAYRIDEPETGAALVVATDIEWQAMAPEAQAEFARFARGADRLVFDAHFRPEEYAEHRGWGHSTWADALDAARQAGVKNVWLMHHAPNRTDAEIDAISSEASVQFPGAAAPTVEDMMENLHE